MSKPNRPSFFRLVVGDQIFTKLKVPPAFLKNLKRINFPAESTIVLKSDAKVSWKVKMEGEEGKGVYFTEGWEKVCKSMKLEVGDLLVLYLVGDDEFELRVYDTTCCEKIWEWGLSSRSEDSGGRNKNNEVKVEEEEDDKVYGHGDEGGEEEEKEEGEEGIEPDETISKNSKQNKCGQKIDFSKLGGSETDSEFVSNYPFFQIIIARSYLRRYPTMHVPMSFSKSHINPNLKKQILRFETGNGQSWPVTLLCDGKYSYRSSLSRGLNKFLKDNSVQVGNLCTFELIDTKRMVFRVDINRGNIGIPQYAENVT